MKPAAPVTRIASRDCEDMLSQFEKIQDTKIEQSNNDILFMCVCNRQKVLSSLHCQTKPNEKCIETTTWWRRAKRRKVAIAVI
eukprot:m.13634 g.13634  ORF g.13634 m.13634 type:complete len:83 (+) comp7577_c0_seq1:453-701(+)